MGNSLVVQWLGLSALTAEGMGFNPQLESKDPTHHVAWPNKTKNQEAQSHVRLVALVTEHSWERGLDALESSEGVQVKEE